MNKRPFRDFLYLALALAAAAAAVVILSGNALAAGPAQVIVELRQNASSGYTTAARFTDQKISGTNNSTRREGKFQRQREGKHFTYVIANLTPATSYSVELSFVEHDFSSPGKRIFNVYIQSGRVLSRLDICSRVGRNAAYQRTFTGATDSSGLLSVAFRSDEAGCRDNATVSTIRVYRGSTTFVEIDAASSRQSMRLPVRFKNGASQNTFEVVLGRLGSRLSLNLLPHRLAGRFSALGTGTGDLSDLVLALRYGTGEVRCLPFTDRFPVWESIRQSQTMTSQVFTCSSPAMPFLFTVTFRAPFYPREEKLSVAPYIHVDVSVTNTGGAPESCGFMLARPHKRTHSSSAFSSFDTGGARGFTYNNYYNYWDETYNLNGRENAVEALAVPAVESDVTFRGPVEGDFSDFTGDSIWGWVSPGGYPNVYNQPDRPVFSFYPRGYSGAEWSINNLAPGATETRHFVMAGYISEPVLSVANSSYRDDTFRFMYRRHFGGVLDVVNYAFSEMDAVAGKASFFDSTVSSDSYLQVEQRYMSDLRDLIVYTFQSYIANTWWACSDAGREWFSVWEGTDCRYHSTIDVEYNLAWFYFDFWPELLRKTMDEWVLYTKSGGPGTYMSHDMGWQAAATGQAYPHDMGVEENANFILLLYRYWRTTGDLRYVRDRFSLVRRLVDFLINCDTNNNGLPDRYTSNTIDQGSPAIQSSRDQTYLGVKCLAAFQAAREMAGTLPSPDGDYERKCRKMVEQINQTLEYDLWLSDHYAVCLDGEVEGADREAYSIYASNGLVYLLSARRNVGLNSNNVARMRKDLVNATRKTLKRYGCTHSTYNAYNEWVSQNIWRDQAALYLGRKLNGANPLAFCSRYWSLVLYFARNMEGGFWDVVIYPGGSGPTGASAAGGGPGGQVTRTVSTAGGASGYSQSLGYYPRGAASLGLIDAVAGLSIDVPSGSLYYRPTAAPLRVPVFSMADWGNADPALRVPTLYFGSTSGSPSVTNRHLLPEKIHSKEVKDIQEVGAGGHAMSPNGDGVNDGSKVSYRLPVPAKVETSIWEGRSRKRRFPAAAKGAGGKSFTWDGKDGSGAVVGDGLYTARVDASADDSRYSLRPASAPVWVNNTVPDLSKDWYLAEGFTGRNATGGDFEEYILIQNPNPKKVRVDVTFMLPGGDTVKRYYAVAPNSRYTITVDHILPDAEVSTHVRADGRVAVERAMYFNGRRAGHASTGATGAGKTWYLAEGYTAQGFDEYVLIQNPGRKAAGVKATFMTPGEGNTEKSYRVGPYSRFTIHVDRILPSHEVSTKIESTEPVVVERAQYLNNMRAGTCSIAARSTSRTWFLAEGYTDQGFEEWVLVQNPQDDYNEITVTFMEKSGANTVKNYRLPPTSRFTISVDDILEKSEVSVKVRSQSPVLVERAMYWNERSDGHACIGTPSPDSEWYLAEGYTSQGFETWILVQNPSDEPVNATFTFMEPTGMNTVREYTVGPRSRFTVGVDEILPDSEVSTRVSADGPIITERAVYFNNRSGGTVSLGIRGF